MNAVAVDTIANTTQSSRYAKAVEVSKRVRWEIERDVIQGRRFNFGNKFLPDGLSRLKHGRELGPAHLRQHLWPGRALHQREDARAQP